MRFFRISAANAEIDRLTGELSAITKERDDLKASFEANAADNSKAAEELQGQLTAANKSVEVLTAEIGTLKASLDSTKAELAKAQEKLANPSEQVAIHASRRAAEITQAQGQPPIAVEPASTPAGGANGVVEQWISISDPREKTAFYRKNQASIEAAWRPAPQPTVNK